MHEHKHIETPVHAHASAYLHPCLRTRPYTRPSPMGAGATAMLRSACDMYTDMSNTLFGHVCQNVSGHVCRNVYGHVYGNVCRHVCRHAYVYGHNADRSMWRGGRAEGVGKVSASILVMAYYLWHISYGISVMAYQLCHISYNTFGMLVFHTAAAGTDRVGGAY